MNFGTIFQNCLDFYLRSLSVVFCRGESLVTQALAGPYIKCQAQISHFQRQTELWVESYPPLAERRSFSIKSGI